LQCVTGQDREVLSQCLMMGAASMVTPWLLHEREPRRCAATGVHRRGVAPGSRAQPETLVRAGQRI